MKIYNKRMKVRHVFTVSKYNDPNNEIMDGWPTIIMWILFVIGLIYVWF